MAALPGTEMAKVWRGLMRWLSDIRDPIALTKADLLAAINATDDWIDLNAAAFNASLPLAAQTGMTAQQKALMFAAVVLRRHSDEFLRKVFSQVD